MNVIRKAESQTTSENNKNCTTGSSNSEFEKKLEARNCEGRKRSGREG